MRESGMAEMRRLRRAHDTPSQKAFQWRWTRASAPLRQADSQGHAPIAIPSLAFAQASYPYTRTSAGCTKTSLLWGLLSTLAAGWRCKSLVGLGSRAVV